jgi:hypothetical protein
MITASPLIRRVMLVEERVTQLRVAPVNKLPNYLRAS